MIAYFFGLLVILLASSLLIVIGTSQISSVEYALTGKSLPAVQGYSKQVMITEQNARTIYNSRVPVTIADAINRMQAESNAYPETISLVDVNGLVPLVVRGLPANDIASQGLVMPLALNGSVNPSLVGSEARIRLNLRLGEMVSITSPFATHLVNLTVAGFFSTGTEEDYELLVSFDTGEQIAGLANGTANAIVIPSSSTINLKAVASEYNLNISYFGAPGTLLIVDSAGYVHYASKILSNGSNSTRESLNASLPYGLYDVLLEQNGVRTELYQFVPLINGSTINLNSTQVLKSAFLSVKVDNASSPKPVLLDSQNNSLSPQFFDPLANSWVFKVDLGTYTLILDGSSHNVFVFGNSTFDATATLPNALLDVHVHTIGTATQPVGYSITVKDLQSSHIVFSSFSTDPVLPVPLESGHTYSVAILTTSALLLQQNVSLTLSNASVTFNVPYLPGQFQNVPISDYGSFGLGSPSGSASFNYFLGTAISSTIALFSIIISLLVVTLFVLDSQLLVSLRNEIRAILFIFPRNSSLFWKISAPLLLLSLSSAGAGIVLSFAAFWILGMNSNVTFAGFGLSAYPILYVAPALFALSMLSWIKMSLSMRVRVYGKGAT